MSRGNAKNSQKFNNLIVYTIHWIVLKLFQEMANCPIFFNIFTKSNFVILHKNTLKTALNMTYFCAYCYLVFLYILHNGFSQSIFPPDYPTITPKSSKNGSKSFVRLEVLRILLGKMPIFGTFSTSFSFWNSHFIAIS